MNAMKQISPVSSTHTSLDKAETSKQITTVHMAKFVIYTCQPWWRRNGGKGGAGTNYRGPVPDYVAYDFVFLSSIVISLTECSTGIIPRVTFVLNTTIQLKNITTISDKTGTLVSGYIARWMPLLSDVVVIFFLAKL
jgi:hypothetical protein